jgi:DNA-binding MarR family transcriptional regulator
MGARTTHLPLPSIVIAKVRLLLRTSSYCIKSPPKIIIQRLNQRRKLPCSAFCYIIFTNNYGGFLMDTALIKDFFDCCREAKKILELLPPLPQGLTPRHIQIIDTISQLEEKNGLVKISDISTALHVTRPSITRLVSELAAAGYAKKAGSATDGRVTYVALTNKGKSCCDFYVKRYHNWVSSQLTGIEPDDLICAAKTIRSFYAALKNSEPPKP